MSELTEQLKAERQIVEAATEGPWIAEYSGEQGNCVLPSDAQSTREAVAVTRLYDRQADAEFIAHARTALPQRNAQVQAVLKMTDDLPDPGPRTGYAAGYNQACRDIRRAIEETHEPAPAPPQTAEAGAKEAGQ